MSTSQNILSLLDKSESGLDAILQATLPTQQQLNQPAKKKRNQKTRQQHKKKKKKKAQAQRVMSQMQEMEQSHGQAVEHLDVEISVKQMASKHVFLQRIWERCWHAAVMH